MFTHQPLHDTCILSSPRQEDCTHILHVHFPHVLVSSSLSICHSLLPSSSTPTSLTTSIHPPRPPYPVSHPCGPTLQSGCWWWFPPDCCFSVSSPTGSPELSGHESVQKGALLIWHFFRGEKCRKIHLQKLSTVREIKVIHRVLDQQFTAASEPVQRKRKTLTSSHISYFRRRSRSSIFARCTLIYRQQRRRRSPWRRNLDKQSLLVEIDDGVRNIQQLFDPQVLFMRTVLQKQLLAVIIIQNRNYSF